MATIDGVSTRTATRLQLASDEARARNAERQGADRAERHNAEAISVRLSPEARQRSAAAAIANANHEAAASADFLAGPDGADLLARLPQPTRRL